MSPGICMICVPSRDYLSSPARGFHCGASSHALRPAMNRRQLVRKSLWRCHPGDTAINSKAVGSMATTYRAILIDRGSAPFIKAS